MSQSLAKIYTHIIFGTKNHANLIDDNIDEKLFSYLGGICRDMECNPVIVGGYKNHVHILSLLSKKISAVDLLEEVKKSSSKWMKTQGEQYADFYWQRGYGIFSVSPTHVDAITEYIKNQKEHHKKRTFRKSISDS